MVVGDPGLNETEWKTNFSLWAIMASPLILGMDLTDLHLSPHTLEIISNLDVIAIDQDPLGKQGRPIVKTADFEIWAKPLADESYAVILINIKEQSQDLSVNWSDVVYDSQYRLTASSYVVRDL
jgi:alpha-galactosidase